MPFDLIAAFLQSTRAAIAPGERHDRIAITVGDEDGGLSPGWRGFGLQVFMQRDIRRQCNQASNRLRQAQPGMQGHRPTLRETREDDAGSGNADRELPVEIAAHNLRSEEHTSELQSLMRISYAVFCLKKKKLNKTS